jgi:hypothetical protein
MLVPLVAKASSEYLAKERFSFEFFIVMDLVFKKLFTPLLTAG